jgi:hypothetical protein
MRILTAFVGLQRALAALGRLIGGLGKSVTSPGADCPDEVSSCSEPDAKIGPILTRPDAPRLFAILEDLADMIGVERPDEVRLGYLPACGVVDLKQPDRRAKQVLILGLPCLHVWSIDELRAVLAHELVHLEKADAAVTRCVLERIRIMHAAPSQRGMTRIWLRPWRSLTGLACRLATNLCTRVCKAMELRADRWAALIVGPDSLISALEKLALVQPVFREMLLTYNALARPGGNVYAHFADVWGQLTPRALAPLRRRLVESSDDADEFHPTLPQRLHCLQELRATSRIVSRGAAGKQAETGAAASRRKTSRRSSRELLTDPGQFESVLHNHLFGAHASPLSVFHRFRR